MTEKTYGMAIREALREEMVRDPTVFLIGEDIGQYGGVFGVTKGLVDEFGPARVRNTPVSEQVIIGAALGAAATGMRPIAEMEYVDFAMVAMDQIVNMVARTPYVSNGQLLAPLVIRAPFGIGRSAAQHSHELAPLFMQTPGLKVVMPATPHDAKGLLKTAIRDNDPVIFLEHKYLYGLKGAVPDDEYTIPFGVAEIKREGRDATIVATSRMVHLALGAANRLQQEKISVEVVDPRTLVPLDFKNIAASVRKTGRVLLVDEGHLTCGVGSEIAARIGEAPSLFASLRAPVKRLHAIQAPIPFSPALEGPSLPSEDSIVEEIRALVKS